MPRPFPVPSRGRARGSAQGRRNAPQTLGGVGHAPPSFTAGCVRVFRPRPDDPNRASGEGRDGSIHVKRVPAGAGPGRHGG